MGPLVRCGAVCTPHQAIEFFRYDSSLNDEEKKKANELKLPCHLNYAACALKLKEWRLAKENCDKARVTHVRSFG